MTGKRHPVLSPCVSLCYLDESDVCQGCGRTLDEIAEWSEMTDSEREAVIIRLQPGGRAQEV